VCINISVTVSVRVTISVGVSLVSLVSAGSSLVWFRNMVSKFGTAVYRITASPINSNLTNRIVACIISFSRQLPRFLMV